MDDLISRSALLEQMHNHYEARNPKQNATMDECCMMVIHAPAVDAVEVVRCKKCKYGKKSETAFAVDTAKPLCECPFMLYPHHWLEFCSYGERRADHERN